MHVFLCNISDSSRNYWDSHVFVFYFSRELFPNTSLALFEGSWRKTLLWLFPVSNINCNWLQDCLKTQLIKCFPSTLHRSNIKTQQLQYRSLSLRTLVTTSFSQSSIFGKCFPSTREFLQFEGRFRNDGLVWTVGLIVVIKLRFRPQWSVKSAGPRFACTPTSPFTVSLLSKAITGLTDFPDFASFGPLMGCVGSFLSSLSLVEQTQTTLNNPAWMEWAVSAEAKILSKQGPQKGIC